MKTTRWMAGSPALLIALAAGSLMPLAFAPFKLWPLALLLPALLIQLWRQARSSKRAFLLGWLFGVGWYGFGVYWLYNSLHDFGNAPPTVAGALTALMILTLAAFIGGLLALMQRLCRGWSEGMILALLPLGWFAMEWAKGWVLTGFPWLSLGYAQTDSPLAGFAPLIGVYGIGALSILASLLLLRLFRHRGRIVAAVVLLVLLVGGAALQQQEWTRPVGQPLRVAMIQGNIPQEMRWRSDTRQRIIDRYLRESESLWGKADLILWPEAAIPGRAEDLRKTLLEPLAERARESGTALLTGILYSDWNRRVYYNSMLLLGAGREQVYHKRHLVPFGEYFPFRRLIGFLDDYIDIPMSDMTPGPLRQPLLSVRGVPLGMSICYEDVFSRDVNRDLPAARVLVNTSNDAWFGDSLAPHQHLQIARMRALETGRPLLRSSNTGPSAFLDEQGQVKGEASGLFVLSTLQGEIQPRQGATPFLAFARIQPWLAGLILVALFLMGLRRKPLERKEPVQK